MNWWNDTTARLSRIEQKLDTIMRVLRRTESEVLMAYEAELAAAETAAKANSDAEDSAEALFKALSDIVAQLKTGSDPATAQRIQDLANQLSSRASRLAAAVVAGTPAAQQPSP